MTKTTDGVFLDENMFGRHDETIGYPHVVLCMAFALRTATDLWGVHLTDTANAASVITPFWTWATGKGLTAANITDMYGSCNHPRRYGIVVTAQAKAAWTAEMQALATQIGYHGPAHGFDTSIIAPVDGTYIEYVRQPGGSQPCKVFYKRAEKTTLVGTTAPPYAATGDVVAWDSGNARFRHLTIQKTGMEGNSSTFHSGVFNELDYANRLATIVV